VRAPAWDQGSLAANWLQTQSSTSRKRDGIERPALTAHTCAGVEYRTLQYPGRAVLGAQSKGGWAHRLHVSPAAAILSTHRTCCRSGSRTREHLINPQLMSANCTAQLHRTANQPQPETNCLQLPRHQEPVHSSHPRLGSAAQVSCAGLQHSAAAAAAVVAAAEASAGSCCHILATKEVPQPQVDSEFGLLAICRQQAAQQSTGIRLLAT
jgi:hypothetical protein